MEIDNLHIIKTQTYNNKYLPLSDDDIDTNTEYCIYQLNISQKSSNSISLPFTYNNVNYKFKNFTYISPSIMLFIIKTNKCEILLIKYDKKNLNIDKTVINIKNIVNKPDNIDDDTFIKMFFLYDERCFLAKKFLHLTFLRLNEMTNTIYYANIWTIISSLDRKSFIFMNNKTKESYFVSLHDIIFSLCKLHFDLYVMMEKNSFTNITYKHKIELDVDICDFGINFYFLVKKENIYFIFLKDNSAKQEIYVTLCELTLKNLNFIYDMKKSFCFNYVNNKNLKPNALKCKIANVDEKEKKYFIITISYENCFDVIICELNNRIYRKYSSSELTQKLFCDIFNEKNFNYITDVFIGNECEYAIIIVNFIYVVFFNLRNFETCMINAKNKKEKYFYINLCDVFKGDKNKCLYAKIYFHHNNKLKFDFVTKYKSKSITFHNKKIFSNLSNQNCLWDIINNFDKCSFLSFKQQKELNIHMYKKRHNFYLYLLAIRLIFAKKEFKIFIDQIDQIQRINTELLFNEKDEMSVMSICNPNSKKGIMNHWLADHFISYKFEPFLSLNFTTFHSINYYTPKYNICDKTTSYYLFDIVLYNNCQIKFILYSFLKTIIFGDNAKKAFAKIALIIQSLYKNKSEQNVILSLLKDYLLRIVKVRMSISYYLDNITNYQYKYKLFSNFVSAFNSRNFNLIIHLIEENYKYKDANTIIVIFIELIIKCYLNREWYKNKYFSSYDINSAVIDCEDKTISFNIFYTKYLRSNKKEKYFDVFKEEYFYIIINILLIANKKCDVIIQHRDILFTKNNQIDLLCVLHLLSKGSYEKYTNVSYANNETFKVLAKRALCYLILRCNFYKEVIEMVNFSIFVKNFEIMKEIKENIIFNTFRNINVILYEEIRKEIMTINGEEQTSNNRKRHYNNKERFSFDCFMREICEVNEEDENNEIMRILKIVFLFINVFFANKSNFITRLLRGKEENKYLRFNHEIKNFFVLLFAKFHIENIFIIASKRVRILFDEISFYQSVIYLSFFLHFANHDSKIFFWKEIIDFTFGCAKNELINENFFLNFFLYSHITQIGDLYEEKLNFIKNYISQNKSNGNLKNLLTQNEKKEKFLKQNDNRENHFSPIFDFSQKNDIFFDLSINDFIKFFANKSSIFKENFDNYVNTQKNKKENEIMYKFAKINDYINNYEILNFNIQNEKFVYFDFEKKEEKNNQNIQTRIQKIINNANNKFNPIQSRLSKEDIQTLNINKRIEIENDNASIDEKQEKLLASNFEINKENPNNEKVSDISSNNNNINKTISNNNTVYESELQDNKDSNSSFHIILPPSNPHRNLSLPEIMNIKKLNQLTETEFKCKYLSIKLLDRFVISYNQHIKQYIFRYLKASLLYNKNNKITNEILIDISSTSENTTNQTKNGNIIIGRTLYPKLKLRKKNQIM